MEDKIKIIVEKLVKAGVNMNAFLKVSGWSIQIKIEEVTGVYFVPITKSKYIRKSLKY